MPPASFLSAIRLNSRGSGRYDVRLDPAWRQGPGVVGGVQSALLLEAMSAEVGDPARLPRSLTVHFVSPARPGPARCVVTILRSGHSLTNVAARLVRAGADGTTTVIATALASFSLPRRGTLGPAQPTMPEVPPWEALRDSQHGDPPPVFTQFCTFRDCVGESVYSGGTDARLGGWGRLKEPVALTPATLAFLADAWPPAMLACHTDFCPVASVALTLQFHAGAGDHGLAPGTPILVEARQVASSEGYSDELANMWAPDGRLLATIRQQVIAFG